MTLSGGRAIEGYSVGVLHLETRYPLPVGNPQHAGTFSFPVCYEGVPVEDPGVLMRGEDVLLPLIMAACERLVARGAALVAGACGSFAHFQIPVARQLSVPFYGSVLTQVPLVLTALGDRPLGLVCASAHTVDNRIFHQCRISTPERLRIVEMRGCEEFDRMLTGRHALDVSALEEELVSVVDQLLERHLDIGAIMLQCSDLAPFSHSLRRRFDLPVHDATAMIQALHRVVAPPSYQF